ncbi:GNAT family N-acetyltransferase [Metabacillus iocasae]|uniref:Ribosomal protein S18 acetylase RimI-like enzyme n=1 Tax=Priestia iocasae TaxID=2291674 RepID=A0ABS2QVY6_9BACI|nr:GNAT family N-acetyltransferase [Metabacillus iocasae]MBM7703648.1 ribosomal protein S18 acetylase RimI-like enzyme [Metabacillus iocasae]
MTIRKARKEEATVIAALLYDVLGSIARSHAAEETEAATCKVFERYVRSEENRYSYRNIIVKEIQGTIAGMMVSYDGCNQRLLDIPIIELVRAKTRDLNYTTDLEAISGDLYIDSICVHPSFRGRGIGSELLQQAEQMAKMQHLRLSLNVEVGNDRAETLYRRIGFHQEGYRMINNKPFKYMVKKIEELMEEVR